MATNPQKKLNEGQRAGRARFKALPFLVVLIPLLYLVDRFMFNSQIMTYSSTTSSFIIELIVLVIAGLAWMFVYSILSVIIYERKNRG